MPKKTAKKARPTKATKVRAAGTKKAKTTTKAVAAAKVPKDATKEPLPAAYTTEASNSNSPVQLSALSLEQMIKVLVNTRIYFDLTDETKELARSLKEQFYELFGSGRWLRSETQIPLVRLKYIGAKDAEKAKVAIDNLGSLHSEFYPAGTGELWVRHLSFNDFRCTQGDQDAIRVAEVLRIPNPRKRPPLEFDHNPISSSILVDDTVVNLAAAYVPDIFKRWIDEIAIVNGNRYAASGQFYALLLSFRNAFTEPSPILARRIYNSADYQTANQQRLDEKLREAHSDLLTLAGLLLKGCSSTPSKSSKENEGIAGTPVRMVLGTEKGTEPLHAASSSSTPATTPQPTPSTVSAEQRNERSHPGREVSFPTMVTARRDGPPTHGYLLRNPKQNSERCQCLKIQIIEDDSPVPNGGLGSRTTSRLEITAGFIPKSEIAKHPIRAVSEPAQRQRWWGKTWHRFDQQLGSKADSATASEKQPMLPIELPVTTRRKLLMLLFAEYWMTGDITVEGRLSDLSRLGCGQKLRKRGEITRSTVYNELKRLEIQFSREGGPFVAATLEEP